MEHTKKQKTLVLLDTHALIHRAFHALPPLTSPAGEPVGAVYGVANIVLKILKDFSPDYIAAAFDRPEPTFRHKAYKEYKAQRAEAPDDLIAQFDTVRALFVALGIQIYDKPGYEADDIIGTLTVEAEAADKKLKIIIASGDLDTTQLVKDDRVVVFTMRKGIADTVLYDENEVRNRFGFKPELLPDFKGLKGDPSDNIKGVPGVGDKTATTLVQRFGSLENIYTALEKQEAYPDIFKGKLPDVLLQHKDDAFFSRDLARIRTDVLIKFQMSDVAWNGIPDAEAARAFLERVGFTSLVSRLALAKKSGVDVTQRVMFGTDETKIATANFFSQAAFYDVVAWRFDDETRAVHITAGLNTCHVAEKDMARFNTDIAQLFGKNIFHISFGGKEILKLLWNAGVTSARTNFDVGIASWVLDPATRDPDSEELFRNYAVSDFSHLRDALTEDLKKSKLERVFFDIEMPLIPVLAGMEHAGILLDKTILAVCSKKLTKQLKEREDRIYSLSGTEFNINSPKQLGELLFGKLGVSSAAVRKTGGGERSTRASELVKLRGAHPVIDEVLAYREEMKLKSTYVDTLPQLVNEHTGRIHTTFNQTGTVTGRLSSQTPNMQNIPIRTAHGQDIRRAFIASPGYRFLSCDYSQIELRIAASLSQDEHMIQAFQSGKDIHTLTASAVNHVPEQEVTSSMRRAAKAINFGILYGMGAVSLAESLGISRKEADSFIRAYFTEFPRIKEFMETLKKQAVEHGYVETLFGRRRYFRGMENLGWQARREAERMAINAPIQGSDADIVKVAMVRLWRELAGDIERQDARLLLQVHDELLFEVRKECVQRIKPRITDIMEHVCKLAVPLTVAVREGQNWQDLA